MNKVKNLKRKKKKQLGRVRNKMNKLKAETSQILEVWRDYYLKKLNNGSTKIRKK